MAVSQFDYTTDIDDDFKYRSQSDNQDYSYMEYWSQVDMVESVSKKSNSNFRNLLSQLRSRDKRVQQNLDDIKDDSNTRVGQLESRSDEIKTAFNNLITTYNAKVSELEAKDRDLQNQINSLRSEIQSLQNQINSLQASANSGN